MTITFEDDEIELVERAARVLAEHSRRDAERIKNKAVEKMHRAARAQWLRIAERIKVARNEPDPGPPPPNLRPLRR